MRTLLWSVERERRRGRESAGVAQSKIERGCFSRLGRPGLGLARLVPQVYRAQAAAAASRVVHCSDAAPQQRFVALGAGLGVLVPAPALAELNQPQVELRAR